MSEGNKTNNGQQLWKNPFGAFDFREFACGWGAAFINITLTYPIHKIIFRQVIKIVMWLVSFSNNYIIFNSDAPWSEDKFSI